MPLLLLLLPCTLLPMMMPWRIALMQSDSTTYQTQIQNSKSVQKSKQILRYLNVSLKSKYIRTDLKRSKQIQTEPHRFDQMATNSYISSNSEHIEMYHTETNRETSVIIPLLITVLFQIKTLVSYVEQRWLCMSEKILLKAFL